MVYTLATKHPADKQLVIINHNGSPSIAMWCEEADEFLGEPTWHKNQDESYSCVNKVYPAKSVNRWAYIPKEMLG